MATKSSGKVERAAKPSASHAVEPKAEPTTDVAAVDPAVNDAELLPEPVNSPVTEPATAIADAIEAAGAVAGAAIESAADEVAAATEATPASPIETVAAPKKRAAAKAKPAAKPKVAAKVAPRAITKARANPPSKKPVRQRSASVPARDMAPATASAPAEASPRPIEILKETRMAQLPNYDLASKVQDTMKEMTDKAKAAYEKSTAMMGEYSDFAKGNVEAVVESGKILASGMQDMGRTYVADGKTAFETMTAEVKELVSVKSPAEFFTLQSALMKKHFDDAMAYGSKSSEGMLKLASDAFAPLSTRMSVAIDKVKAAA